MDSWEIVTDGQDFLGLALHEGIGNDEEKQKAQIMENTIPRKEASTFCTIQHTVASDIFNMGLIIQSIIEHNQMMLMMNPSGWEILLQVGCLFFDA